MGSSRCRGTITACARSWLRSSAPPKGACPAYSGSLRRMSLRHICRPLKKALLSVDNERNSNGPAIDFAGGSVPKLHMSWFKVVPKKSIASYKQWLIGLVFVAVGAFRIYECSLSPPRAGDVYRHLLTGIMIREEGWSAAARSLDSWSPQAKEIAAWTSFPYNYPPLYLGFFYAMSWIWPSVFAVKVVLTFVEAVNTYLCFKITRSIWSSLLYWCLPLSVWWVSREGQAEPMQNLFVLAGLLLLRSEKSVAYWAWSSACLVKLSAVFLAPLFILHWFSVDFRRKLLAIKWLCVGAIPLAVAAAIWPVFSQIMSTAKWPVIFNAWHWRSIFDAHYGGWYPIPCLIVMRLMILALVGVGLYLRCRRALSTGALVSILAFIGASAFMGVFQGWYFVALLPFLMLVTSARFRIIIIVICQSCDPQSVYSLAVRPVGWGAPNEKVLVNQPLAKP